MEGGVPAEQESQSHTPAEVHQNWKDATARKIAGGLEFISTGALGHMAFEAINRGHMLGDMAVIINQAGGLNHQSLTSLQQLSPGTPEISALLFGIAALGSVGLAVNNMRKLR